MKIVDDFQLPIKIVSEEEKRRLESILRKSNTVLKTHHQAAKRLGFRGRRRSFYAAVCNGSYSVPEHDMREILKSREIEQDFLAIYSRIIFKTSWRWSRILGNSVTRSDICAVGVEAFLMAFCSFTEEDKKFSTYLVHCVERHTIKFASSCGIIYFPPKISKLRHKVSNLMLSEGISFNSAAEKMRLSEKTKATLMNSMFKVGNLSPEIDVPERKKHIRIGTDEFPEISDLEFSGLEGLVFREFLSSGGDLNLSELSRGTMNPKTGRPYTRMAMCLAWSRVRQRISLKLGRVA